MPTSVAGRPLRCPHCHCEHFDQRHAQIDTRKFSLIDFDMWNPPVTAFICRRCRRIEWFLGLDAAEERKELTKPQVTDCLSCEGEIPADAQRCPHCGWSYLD